MKKILLTTFVLLFTGAANAQVGGAPRELTCTEEAFTFKANITSGWHLGQVSMGPSGLPKGMSDYAAVRSFDKDVPEKQLTLSEYIFNQMHLHHTANLPIPRSLILPSFSGFQLDKFDYRFSYNSVQPRLPAVSK